MSEKILEMTIEELDLSVHSYNCLKRAGYNTVEQLCEATEEELMSICNLGRKASEEIFQKLLSLERCFFINKSFLFIYMYVNIAVNYHY